MKEDSIDDLKKRIAQLQREANEHYMVLKLLVAAGHVSEDKVNQARELALPL